MNFKKFNGSTWDAIHHKTYDTLTESLTAFPATLQASGEPLTDYLISGNTVQNGTPSPESPVDVVGCGVWDETHQSYKLPITVNGTEHPIYLGQVETARRFKKYELTGRENISLYGASATRVGFYFNRSDSILNGRLMGICSHFKPQPSPSGSTIDGITFGANDNNFYFTFSANSVSTYNLTDTASIKAWLAAQYANDTPVTIWYVLAEPETAVVNEPIHKIRNYADTITMAQAEVTIPTSDGDNTISFGTTVQPSAMSATFKGWHAVQGVKQYDGSEWR